jgi:adenylate cyclase
MRYNLACALSRNLGDVDGAIEMLEPYVATATMGEMLHVEVDPDLDPLRADPRFQALIDAATRRLAGAA